MAVKLCELQSTVCLPPDHLQEHIAGQDWMKSPLKNRKKIS
jgi:hypothetical protein